MSTLGFSETMQKEPSDTPQSKPEPLVKGGRRVIDCDVHNIPAREEDILPYLPPFYRRRGVRLLNRHEYPHPESALRKDSAPADGGPIGSSLPLLQEQLLDKYEMDYAVLTGEWSSMGLLPDVDYAAALALAYNDYVIEHWLPLDRRLLGSIRVAAQDPAQAAEEIRRIGSHSQIVQVYMISATAMPLGQRFYHPIFEAARDMGLPIALHPGWDGMGISHAPTPVGYPGSYFEWHSLWAVGLMSQLCSLVCEGVFEKFPGLKFVFLEGGVSWVPHLMWRMDKDWKGLRSNHPLVKRLPSEYIVENARFSTQPVDEPPESGDLIHIFRMIQAEKTVVFSSDYPHWDFDDPFHALPRLEPELANRIFYENARELYNLPENPPLKTELDQGHD